MVTEQKKMHLECHPMHSSIERKLRKNVLADYVRESKIKELKENAEQEKTNIMAPQPERMVNLFVKSPLQSSQ